MPRKIQAWHDHTLFVCAICNRSYQAHEAASRCEENHRLVETMYPLTPAPVRLASMEQRCFEDRLAALEAKVNALMSCNPLAPTLLAEATER